jgi:hypothetical protein
MSRHPGEMDFDFFGPEVRQVLRFELRAKRRTSLHP